jgi:DNA replication and repair protein RecF
MINRSSVFRAFRFNAPDLIGPQEVKIVVGSPQERRRALNLHICQIDTDYTDALREYEKLITKRNMVLKQGARQDVLMAVDECLTTHAASIIEKRKNFVKDISPLAVELYRKIAGGELELIYKPDIWAQKRSFFPSL